MMTSRRRIARDAAIEAELAQGIDRLAEWRRCGTHPRGCGCGSGWCRVGPEGAAPGAALPAVLRRKSPPVSQRLWCVRGSAACRLELERELPVCPGDLSDDVARRDAGAAVVAGRDALAVVRATNAVRIATSFSARLFNLFITNVSGVQKQMYVAGTKLLETYMVPPLLPNQVLAIGVTSYKTACCISASTPTGKR